MAKVKNDFTWSVCPSVELRVACTSHGGLHPGANGPQGPSSRGTGATVGPDGLPGALITGTAGLATPGEEEDGFCVRMAGPHGHSPGGRGQC